MSCSYKDKFIFVVYNLDTSEILHHENELLYGVVQTGERWNMSCVQKDAHNMVHKAKRECETLGVKRICLERIRQCIKYEV